MDCEQCGEHNMEGSERCWKCASPLRAAKRSTSPSAWILWSVVAAVALLAIAMMFSAGGGSGGGASGGVSVSATATAAPGSGTATGSVPATKTK